MADISIAEVIEVGPGWNKVRGTDGQIYTLEGNYSWRSNNPGNLEYGPFAIKMGAIAEGKPPKGRERGFAIFPTKEVGEKARATLQFESSNYKDLSVAKAISRFAPPSENDTQAYIRAVTKAAGISPDTKMSALTPDQRAKFLAAQEQHEGYVVGSIVGPTGKPMPKGFSLAGGRAAPSALAAIEGITAPVPATMSPGLRNAPAPWGQGLAYGTDGANVPLPRPRPSGVSPAEAMAKQVGQFGAPYPYPAELRPRSAPTPHTPSAALRLQRGAVAPVPMLQSRGMAEFRQAGSPVPAQMSVQMKASRQYQANPSKLPPLPPPSWAQEPGSRPPNRPMINTASVGGVIPMPSGERPKSLKPFTPSAVDGGIVNGQLQRPTADLPGQRPSAQQVADVFGKTPPSRSAWNWLHAPPSISAMKSQAPVSPPPLAVTSVDNLPVPSSFLTGQPKPVQTPPRYAGWGNPAEPRPSPLTPPAPFAGIPAPIPMSMSPALAAQRAGSPANLKGGPFLAAPGGQFYQGPLVPGGRNTGGANIFGQMGGGFLAALAGLGPQSAAVRGQPGGFASMFGGGGGSGGSGGNGEPSPSDQYAMANSGGYRAPSEAPAGTVQGTNGYVYRQEADGSYTKVGKR